MVSPAVEFCKTRWTCMPAAQFCSLPVIQVSVRCSPCPICTHCCRSPQSPVTEHPGRNHRNWCSLREPFLWMWNHETCHQYQAHKAVRVWTGCFSSCIHMYTLHKLCMCTLCICSVNSREVQKASNHSTGGCLGYTPVHASRDIPDLYRLVIGHSGQFPLVQTEAGIWDYVNVATAEKKAIEEFLKEVSRRVNIHAALKHLII